MIEVPLVMDHWTTINEQSELAGTTKVYIERNWHFTFQKNLLILAFHRKYNPRKSDILVELVCMQPAQLVEHMCVQSVLNENRPGIKPSEACTKQ